MKRLLISLFLVFGAVAAQADEKSERLLNNLAEIVNGYNNYEIYFTVLERGDMPSIHSYTIVADSNKYYLVMAGMEVFCDGVNRDEVNPIEKVVYQEWYNPYRSYLLENPEMALRPLQAGIDKDKGDSGFKHEYKGQEMYGGRKCDVVFLSTTDQVPVVKQSQMYLNPMTGLPVAIKYWVDGADKKPVEIVIGRITPLKTVKQSRFVINKKKYEDRGYTFQMMR